MIKELGNWAKGIGQVGKLEVEIRVAWTKLLNAYCEVYHLEDYESVNNQVIMEINEYEENNMSEVVGKFMHTVDLSKEILTIDDITEFIFRENLENKRFMSQKDVNELIVPLVRAIVLYLIGVDEFIEIYKQLNKKNDELNGYSNQVFDAVEDNLIHAIGVAKDITRNATDATKTGLEEMKPIVKQGIKESIPVAKKYVKNIKDSFKSRK